MSSSASSSCLFSTFRLLISSPKLPLLTPSSSSSSYFKPHPKSPFFSFSSSSISFQPLASHIPNSQLKSQLQQQQQQQEDDDPTSSLPPSLLKIVTLFQSVTDPKSKYQQLLHYATQLPPFPPHFKTDSHRVRGCVSQVWVRAYPDPTNPSLVKFDADSDSQLTKGLAALLVFGLSGESPGVIAKVSPKFVNLLGLNNQSLTASRNNGFLNMFKLMQEKAREIGGLGLGGQDEILKGEMDVSEQNNGGFERNLQTDNVEVEESSNVVNEYSGEEEEEEEEGEEETETETVIHEVEEVSSNGGTVMGGRRERIIERLKRELNPVELDLEDVSHMHAGHAGVQGNTGGETHFNLRIVSKEFEGKSAIKRHRLVLELLKEEFESGLHALSIVTKTPSES